MLKKALIAILTLGSMTANAQMLSVNDAKVKLDASASYLSGTPIKGNPDGTFQTYQHVFYNPIFSPMTKLGVEFIHQSNDGGDAAANHYYRIGVNAMHVFLLPEKTQGIAVTANLYDETSFNGAHHFDGVLSTLFMFKLGAKDARGVGFVWLLNNPSKMIGLPIFTWQKTNKHWSFNWMTWLGDFNYNFNEQFRITASYGFAFERYWIEHEGEINMANQIVTTPALSFHYTPSKHLDFGIYGGYNLAFMGSRFNKYGKEYLGKLDTRIDPFIQGRLIVKY